MRRETKRQKILVGMSGGVDSSVAAALLLEQGHRVEGVFMEIYGGAPDAGARSACYGPEKKDIEDARKVARHLDIPLHLVDLRREYRRDVLNPFLREYQAGRTPNPCIICNRLVKFGYLLDRAGAAGIEFDLFATGHYARIATDRRSGRFVLRQPKDEKKDQTYFLYRLSQEQLARTLFPLGMKTKLEVRKYAHSRGLPVSDKEESQDFFSGDRSSLCGGSGRPGPIADRTGKVLGRHRGIVLYTIGQRKGLGIAAGKPLYVTAIIPETDTVIVGEESECYRAACLVSAVNYMTVDRLEAPLRVRAKIRSGQVPAPAVLRPLARGTAELIFDRPQWAVTPGQSAVFYRRKTLVGGGIIEH